MWDWDYKESFKDSIKVIGFIVMIIAIFLVMGLFASYYK